MVLQERLLDIAWSEAKQLCLDDCVIGPAHTGGPRRHTKSLPSPCDRGADARPVDAAQSCRPRTGRHRDHIRSAKSPRDVAKRRQTTTNVLAGQRQCWSVDLHRREGASGLHTAEAAGSKPAAPTRRRRSQRGRVRYTGSDGRPARVRTLGRFLLARRCGDALREIRFVQIRSGRSCVPRIASPGSHLIDSLCGKVLVDPTT